MATTADPDLHGRDEGPLVRALSGLERLGNKLPHPFWLFALLAGIILVLSAVLSAAGASAVSPADGETVEVCLLYTSPSPRD